jgi:hypothetical protein
VYSTCQCPDCQHLNPGQTDSEVTNPATLKTESFESGRNDLSPYPNSCQDCSEVPKPPPVTDPRIVDYYYNYYRRYENHHRPTNGRFDSEAPKPPLVTDPCIVYYYYYYTYYFLYHEADDISRSRHPSHEKNRRAFSSRIPSPVRSAASNSTAALSSHASARGKLQMNIGRPRASILKSVYMTSWASRIPRPINRDKLHCRSRLKVAFGKIRVIQFYK